MQLTPKASLQFKIENVSYKTTFGQNVVNCLTPLATGKNSKYAVEDLPVPVAELKTLNDNLIAAAAARVDGGRAAANALKNATIEWNAGFTATANYITVQAAGNAADIISAGFIPTKSQTQSQQKPGAITNFMATINGSKGAIIADGRKGVPTAKGYVVTSLPPGATISYVGDTVIITAGDAKIYLSVKTKGKVELYNLPSGVPYSVSMFAINSAGNGPATTGHVVIPQ